MAINVGIRQSHLSLPQVKASFTSKRLGYESCRVIKFTSNASVIGGKPFTALTRMTCIVEPCRDGSHAIRLAIAWSGNQIPSQQLIGDSSEI